MRLRIAALAALLPCTTVLAADLPPAARAPAAVPVAAAPVYDWTGFYIGAMGGYGWSDQVSVTVGGITATGNSNDIKGGFAGGTLGYNFQTGPAVFGVEVDGAWSGMGFSQTGFGVTVSDKLQAFGSVTGRLGWAASSLLLYAKGGYAWADNQLSATGFGLGLSESHFHSGWTIGGGVEYLFVPNWSGKVEYMYADYGSVNYLTNIAPGGIGFGFTTHTVKAGTNYHFGGPVVARY
jgi:outer membrane immunogenic protein